MQEVKCDPTQSSFDDFREEQAVDRLIPFCRIEHAREFYKHVMTQLRHALMQTQALSIDSIRFNSYLIYALSESIRSIIKGGTTKRFLNAMRRAGSAQIVIVY